MSDKIILGPVGASRSQSARFPCLICQERIKPNERVYWEQGNYANSWHTRCGTQDYVPGASMDRIIRERGTVEPPPIKVWFSSSPNNFVTLGFGRKTYDGGEARVARLEISEDLQLANHKHRRVFNMSPSLVEEMYTMLGEWIEQHKSGQYPATKRSDDN